VTLPSSLVCLLLGLLLLLSGCSHVIPARYRQDVDETVRFRQAQQLPTQTFGKKILWGGLILDAQAGTEESELVLYSYKLDRWGEPVAIDDDGGRYLLKTTRFLDPAIYDEGLFVTLAGTLEGVEPRSVGEVPYVFPVVRAEKIHLWEGPFRWGLKPHPNIYVPYYIEDESYPRSHPYDPGPIWGPYWYRPAGVR